MIPGTVQTKYNFENFRETENSCMELKKYIYIYYARKGKGCVEFCKLIDKDPTLLLKLQRSVLCLFLNYSKNGYTYIRTF